VPRYQDVALRTAYLVAPEADAADGLRPAVPASPMEFAVNFAKG